MFATARRAAGMTQVELAAGRFTKQYVSQIERGEVVPSDELLDWLAERLGVERLYLETGLGASDLERIEQRLAEGQALLDTRRDAEAAELFRELRQSLAPGAPRIDPPQGDARRGMGADPDSGASPRQQSSSPTARYRAASPTPEERSRDRVPDGGLLLLALDDAVPRTPSLPGRSSCSTRLTSRTTGCARTSTSGARAATAGSATTRLPARTSSVRSSSCDALGDDRRRAEVNLQASLVADRQGRLVLARRYAETSRDLYELVGDDVTEGPCDQQHRRPSTTVLGNDEVAIAQLREAFAIFVDAQLEVEAGYALSSLAEIHRERGDLEEAEIVARRALALLEGRIDHVQEIGTAQLVLARSYLGQGELERGRGHARVGRRELRADGVGQSPGPLVDGARRARARAPQRARGGPPLSRSCDGVAADRPRNALEAPETALFGQVERLRDPHPGDDSARGDHRQLSEHPGPRQCRGRNSLERTCGMITKGTLLRLVVSLSAFASLASLAGGLFDGH